MALRKVQNWLIGISGSNMDNVITYRVSGTSDQVKKHLLALVKESKDADTETWEYGTDNEMEIEQRAGGILYAFGCWADYHDDYTATPEMEVETLDAAGRLKEESA